MCTKLAHCLPTGFEFHQLHLLCVCVYLRSCGQLRSERNGNFSVCRLLPFDPVTKPNIFFVLLLFLNTACIFPVCQRDFCPCPDGGDNSALASAIRMRHVRDVIYIQMGTSSESDVDALAHGSVVDSAIPGGLNGAGCFHYCCQRVRDRQNIENESCNDSERNNMLVFVYTYFCMCVCVCQLLSLDKVLRSANS